MKYIAFLWGILFFVIRIQSCCSLLTLHLTNVVSNPYQQDQGQQTYRNWIKEHFFSHFWSFNNHDSLMNLAWYFIFFYDSFLSQRNSEIRYYSSFSSSFFSIFMNMSCIQFQTRKNQKKNKKPLFVYYHPQSSLGNSENGNTWGSSVDRWIQKI